MSSFIGAREIILSIMRESKILNNCLEEWYKINLDPDDIKDFEGCCNEDEMNLLLRCYNIFSENTNLRSFDNDVVKSLVAYYYMLTVFESYLYEFIGKKYLRIVDEEPSEVPNNKIFTDNNGNKWAYYWNKYDDDEDYIEVENMSNKNSYYVSNKNREADPYFYFYEDGSRRVKFQYMNCLEKILTTKKSRDYYKLLYKSDEEWVSQIRRIILNMNTEPFEGHKGGKQRVMKKNKRTVKKYRKNRKNKLTKRMK